MTLVAPGTREMPPATEVLFKEARRRRRRRRLGWGFLALLILSAAIVFVSQLSSQGPAPSRHTTVRPRTTVAAGAPAAIVAWTSGFRVVVISTRTGHLERTLASSVSILAPGLPSVSVSPTGMVFFESASPSPYNHGDGSDQIFAVPITGGPVRDIGPGSDPQVSPNGRFLAYISPDPEGQAGEAPYLVPPVGIAIATLSPEGTPVSVRTLEPGPAQLNQGASDLTWSSDSRHLAFDLLQPSTNIVTSWTVDVLPSVTSLAAAYRIPLHPGGLTWNGYGGRSRSGAPQGLGVLTLGTGGQEIVTINPLTGRATGRLFRIPAVVCTATFPAGDGGCFSDFSNEVTGDSAGRNVLVAGAVPFLAGRPTPSDKALLFRWHDGEAAPIRLSEEVFVATWGPS